MNMTNKSVGTAPTPSDKKLILSGMAWSAIQMVVNQGFVIVIRMVLARLLFPEQFGIVGMALVFTNLVQMFNDIGIGAALIQKKEEQLTPVHYHTAFWTGIVWSILLYLVMSFLLAPLIADFYKEPILRSIIPVLCIGILSSPMNLVQQAILTKKMDFKKIAVVNNAATLFSGVLSLILAMAGAGIWSLVFNTVASFLIVMPLFFRATDWRPRLVWNKQAFRDIFGFGLYTTGTSVTGYVMNNVSHLLIGKLLSAASLGIYTLAFMLTDIFRNKLMSVMNSVMFPVYGKKQDDIQAVKKYYLKVIQFNALVVYPIMLFFLVFGEPFVTGFFGPKWVPAIMPLKILALAVMLQMLVNSHTVVLRGIGNAKLEMQLQLLKALLYIPCLGIGVYYYGIDGACWAMLINKLMEIIIVQIAFNRLTSIKISTREFLANLKTPFVASFITLLVSYSVSLLPVHYIAGGIVMLACYGSITWLLMKNELKAQFASIRKLKNNLH